MNLILEAREQRSHHITKLMEQHKDYTIVVLKLNVVGINKNPLNMRFICMLFDGYMKKEFGYKIIKSQKQTSNDGDYIFYVIKEEGNLVKERTIYIEDHNYFGRLVDLDVYYKKSISRSDLQCEMRTCLICDNYAHVCVRTQAHSLEEINDKVNDLIIEFLPKLILNETVGQIYQELELYPRFGLVSRHDNGCHEDMDFELFKKSTFAIKPYLKEFIKAGFAEIDPFELQRIGIEAEKAMLKATSGINTQKGLIFVLGVFLPALTRTILLNETRSYFKDEMKRISSTVIGDYFDNIDKKQDLSHGDEIYLKHGIKGIRGEAINGFDLLFKECCLSSDSLETGYEFLIYSMSQIDDTTIIHRKGIEVANRVKQEMKQLMENGGYHLNPEFFNEISQKYKEEGISPGGSSDLLVARMIYKELSYLLK